MSTPEELIPDEWFETDGELTRDQRKERAFHLIYGMSGKHCPDTQEMRDRLSAYINYGQDDLKSTKLHEMMDKFRDALAEDMSVPENTIQTITCKSMQFGRGCGHPINDHLHAFTDNFPTADCHCCDGKRWDPHHITTCTECIDHLRPKFERTEAGELLNPRVEMREFKPEPKNMTPEDMAAQFGVSIEELPDVLQSQIDMYTTFMQQTLNRFVPPKMNRAQRRARDKAMRRHRRV